MSPKSPNDKIKQGADEESESLGRICDDSSQHQKSANNAENDGIEGNRLHGGEG
jgi:hypothetical protein